MIPSLFPGFVGLVDVAVYRSELFCLHGSGRLSHLSLLSAERCIERLLRREAWVLASAVCCMFQHAITTGRVRYSSYNRHTKWPHLEVQCSYINKPEFYFILEISSLDCVHQDLNSFYSGQEINSHRPPRAPEVSAQFQHTSGADRAAGRGHHKGGASWLCLQQPEE